MVYGNEDYSRLLQRTRLILIKHTFRCQNIVY